ncbi:MAG: MFS transporter [Nitrospinota bacterium]|nr:MAG: MFS transporter [Nitrospinota bacterium]
MPGLDGPWNSKSGEQRSRRMSRVRGFFCIFSADLLVRVAYQMGKTPLLPIFAATLGATDLFLGLIVSVSTVTGMVLKPFIGIFSDRWGRRSWLLIGTTFFAVMPFAYRFVQTPGQLLFVRIVHGLATAIYGPVTLAYVVELSRHRRAERLAWFGLPRSAGYVAGPIVAGWLLLLLEPATVFTVIGVVSSLAFLPILLLPPPPYKEKRSLPPLVRHTFSAFYAGSRTLAVWLAGGVEAALYVALYAVKAFLPIHALTLGVNVAMVGTFFGLQEGTHMLLNPLGGRMGDRFGYRCTIGLGMVVVGITLLLLTLTGRSFMLMGLAFLMGVAQALVLPSTVALVSTRIEEQYLGAGMGLIGTLRNAGKVVGPTGAGLLIRWLEFTVTFRLLGVILLLGTAFAWLFISQQQKTRR